jgi:hypothetical protein
MPANAARSKNFLIKHLPEESVSEAKADRASRWPLLDNRTFRCLFEGL